MTRISLLITLLLAATVGSAKGPSILVIGYGAIGGHIIEEAGKQGWDKITVVGRTTKDNLPLPIKMLFKKYNVTYIGRLNLNNAQQAQHLSQLMAAHQFTFHTAAGYPTEDHEVWAAVNAFKTILNAAISAGYTPGGKKRIVIAGSPPARVHRQRGLQNNQFEEDFLVQNPSELGPAGSTPYFRAKIEMSKLLDNTVAWVEFAPTNVVSAWSDHGNIEVLPKYWEDNYQRIPDRIVDTVAGSDVGRAALTVAQKGKEGEVYQIVGEPMSIAQLLLTELRMTGYTGNPSIYPLSDTELDLAIRHGDLLKTGTKLMRLGWLMGTAGLFDPIGPIPDEAFKGSYSSLVLTMGEERDGRKAATLGITRGQSAAIYRDLARHAHFLALKGRIPLSTLTPQSKQQIAKCAKALDVD